MSTLVPKEIITNVLMAAQAAAQQTMIRAGENAELAIFHEGYMTALAVVATGLDVPVRFNMPDGQVSRVWSESWIPSSSLMIGIDTLYDESNDDLS